MNKSANSKKKFCSTKVFIDTKKLSIFYKKKAFFDYLENARSSEALLFNKFTIENLNKKPSFSNKTIKFYLKEQTREVPE